MPDTRADRAGWRAALPCPPLHAPIKRYCAYAGHLVADGGSRPDGTMGIMELSLDDLLGAAGIADTPPAPVP